MEYLHFGNASGEPLVILPGLSLKSVMNLKDLIVSAYAPLAKNYDLYLFDHIEEEPEGYGIADMAKDTLNAFDRLGLDRIHLMGVSMGGMVAQTIALLAPERMRSLILCSTAMNTVHGDPAVFAEWQMLAEQRNTEALAAAFGKSVYTPSFFEAFKAPILASCSGATERDFRNFLISLSAARAFDVSDEIRKIACPVYVLGAGEDRVLGTQAAYDLIEALRCAYDIYDGYGHGVYDEAPDYLDHIAAFLKGEKTFRLAMKHIYGDGVPEDNDLAFTLLTEARALGHMEATYNLGVCCHYGYGTDIDLSKAFALYLESAEAGYGKGMELVGRFYNRGIFVKRDRTQAERWLKNAMESGDPDAVEEAKKEWSVSQ